MIENLHNKVIGASGLDIDRKFSPWAKFIDKINYDKKDGYMFVGEFIKDRTIEFDPKERLILVCARYGSRKNASNYYRLCILRSSGDVEAVGEEFSDEDRGWALVIRPEVERLLESISPAPSPAQKKTYEVVLDHQTTISYIWITCHSCKVRKNDDGDVYVIEAGEDFIEFDAPVDRIVIPATNEVIYRRKEIK